MICLVIHFAIYLEPSSCSTTTLTHLPPSTEISGKWDTDTAQPTAHLRKGDDWSPLKPIHLATRPSTDYRDPWNNYGVVKTKITTLLETEARRRSRR